MDAAVVRNLFNSLFYLSLSLFLFLSQTNSKVIHNPLLSNISKHISLAIKKLPAIFRQLSDRREK